VTLNNALHVLQVINVKRTPLPLTVRLWSAPSTNTVLLVLGSPTQLNALPEHSLEDTPRPRDSLTVSLAHPDTSVWLELLP
jgi:hypothetical protein